MEQKRCMGCMQLKSGPVCEHCGYDEKTPTPRHHLPAGTVLNNQYLVGRALGQGGFGITYLGWDLNLETPVAIKEYFPSGYVHRDSTHSLEVVGNQQLNAQFLNGREYFLREAKSLARLADVPEIVHIRTYFQANGTAYIVMEYVRGIPLNQYVVNKGYRLSVPETLAILKPVMEALAKVHDENLIHRDISPDNIMLLPNGQVKLLDFGAARNSENADPSKELPRSTQAVAKHGFAPIEQYQSRGALGPWTDVYALCATFFYCVAGSAPTAATDRMVYRNNMDWENLAPELTAKQVDALNRGMALLPKERTSSVRELYAQLFNQELPLPKSASGMNPPSPSYLKPKMDNYPATAPVKSASGTTDYPKTVPVAPNGGTGAYPKTAPATAPTAEKDYPSTVPVTGGGIGQTERMPSGPKDGNSAASDTGNKKTDKKGLAVAAVVLTALAVVAFFFLHIWSDPTCTRGSTCILCGKEGTEPALGHDWAEATCLEAAVCLNCGETKGEALGHNWKPATCEEPETCTNCGETVGTVSGHDWAEATYTSPETCRICGETRGNVKGWIGTVDGTWERFYSAGYSSWCWVLEEPIENCKSYTMTITITDVSYGNVEGPWLAFRRDAAGNWVNMGTFELVGDTISITYEFDTPTAVCAVAAVIYGGRSCSFSKSLSVSDVVVFED